MGIREFEWKDIEKIMEIELESFDKDVWSIEEFMKWYELCRDGFLVYESDNEIVGYIIVQVLESGKGYIRSLAVKKKYRNKGIGRKLIMESVSKLKLNRLELHVRVGNPAVEFYKKLGFEEIRRFEKAYRDGEDAIYMALELK
ncbi:MAG: GNAT family N-acetyltransferase [Candidatus Micrarchaeota archaeon]|nr:GNAT family N-acetyltransferase [Candidatus Micrarchaeota archaeon]